MRWHAFLFLGILTLTLTSCFSSEEKAVKPMMSPQQLPGAAVVAKPVPSVPPKDKSLETLVRYLEQADAIHREAWWVLTEERRPGGKSPFGKVQRALLSSQGIKLPNKSLFRCDRYVVKRDVLGLPGYPQNLEVFEKCSDKLAAKLLAQVMATSDREVQLTFYPENLEEVLGLGASVVNKAIQCVLRGNEFRQLINLTCKHWAQDRTKEQMIRLDTYEYEKEGKNLIKLRGKVYENLMDTRSIVVDVPLEGKVEVLETELYPPVEEPPKPAPVPAKVVTPKLVPKLSLPPPRDQVVDPDVLMQQQQSSPESSLETPEQFSQQPQEPPQEQPEGGGVRHGR